MSLDRIIFPPSAMCLFTFYIQLGSPQCMLLLWPLKSEFGSLVSTTCICYVWVAKSGNYWEKRREKGEREREKEGEGEEGEKEYKSLKHPHLQPPHPGGKCLLFQSFSCLTQSCKISNLPQNNVFVASYFYSVIEKASWYNMNISQALGGWTLIIFFSSSSWCPVRLRRTWYFGVAY